MSQTIFRFAAVVVMAFLCSQSSAGVIGEIVVNPFSPQIPLQFDGTNLVLNTSSLSALEFLGVLDQQSNVNVPNPANGTISLSGVSTIGSPSVTPVTVGPLQFDSVTQLTSGGSFALSDPSGGLLLGGTFGSGVIDGNSLSASAGFGTDDVTFNGGSLLSFIKPEGSFGLSLILADPLAVLPTSGELSPFDAEITGQILVQGLHPPDGQVPEPGSLLMFSPILVFGLVSRRRRLAKI